MRAVVIAFVLLAVCAATADAYTNSKMGFAVDFPGAFAVEDKDDSVGAKQVIPGAGTFAVTATDFTGKVTVASGQEAACAEAVVNGFISKQTLLSKTPFAVPNGAGFETLTTGNGMIIRARIHCVPPHVFMVMAGFADTNKSDGLFQNEYRTYFDSFRILPK